MTCVLGVSNIRLDPETHRYYAGGRPVPGVTSVLERAGLVDYTFCTEEGLWRGSRVHAACAYDDESTLNENSVLPEDLGYLEGWRAFRRDSGFAAGLIEHLVFHPLYRFAGTLDRAGSLPTIERVIVDIKTGDIRPATAIQLAAYAVALDQEAVWHRFAVRLRPDGRYFVKEFPVATYRQDVAVFLGALQVANWKTTMRIK